MGTVNGIADDNGQWPRVLDRSGSKQKKALIQPPAGGLTARDREVASDSSTDKDSGALAKSIDGQVSTFLTQLGVN